MRLSGWILGLCGTIYVHIAVLSCRNKPPYSEMSERLYSGSRFPAGRYICATAVTANRAKGCTVVALRWGSSVLTIVVHPDGAR